MNEDNHFRYLIVVYSIADGGIVSRYSAHSISEAMQKAQEFKVTYSGAADIIVQKVEHWVVF